ncbi:hypothetical protein MMC26_001604 [Xylographa opegraphella]|nr:hypothetical protein [Xylographa opegraphella]
MGNTICTSYGLGPPTKVVYKYPYEYYVDYPPKKITYVHQFPRRMEYRPENAQWAGIARNLEEYLCEQNKIAKYRREKEKYRCKRPHLDERPPGDNIRAPNDVFYTPPQWPPMQAGWADPRPPPRQQQWPQVWPQHRVPGYAPTRPVPQNPNQDSRSFNEESEEDDFDEDDHVPNFYPTRTHPSSRRRSAIRGRGRMQEDEKNIYESEERHRIPPQPQRASGSFPPYQRTRGRRNAYERPYESDPEGRYGRTSYRGRWPSDGYDGRAESPDRRAEDEGGVADDA